MNLLKLQFKAVESNGWPKLQFFVDNDLIEDFEFESSIAEVMIPIELIDGHHNLTIEIYGKTENNPDQSVELINMYVDDIQLPDMYKWLGVYEYNDIRLPQALSWHCNGFWSWEFKTPLVSWLIDKKIENTEKYNPPEITHEETLLKEQEKISRFENRLNSI